MGDKSYLDAASGVARSTQGPQEPDPSGSELSSIGDDASERHGTSHETPDSSLGRDDMHVETHHASSLEAMTHSSSEALAAGDKDDLRNWPAPQLRDDPLEAPEPRPGFKQRWIRYSIINDVDATNWSRAQQAAWRPRDPATLTESEKGMFPVRSSSTGDFIQIEDLVLCEIPEHFYRQLRERTEQATERQDAAVLQEVRKASQEGVQQGMPVIQASMKSTRSVGRRPKVMDD